MSLDEGTALGSYRIVEQIGRGGMATVYKAHHPGLDRYVAIKVLPDFFAEDEEYRDRFQQEARSIARLKHPNILNVFDFGQERGITYLLLELVEERVVAHHHVRALAHDEVLGLDATLPQLGDLLEQYGRVDDDAVADDAHAVRVEDARRDQLELELAVLGDDGVAGVVAALGADDHLGLLGEVIDDLALAFVAPLAADEDDDQRGYSVPGSGRLVSRL